LTAVTDLLHVLRQSNPKLVESDELSAQVARICLSEPFTLGMEQLGTAQVGLAGTYATVKREKGDRHYKEERQGQNYEFPKINSL
jgi:hypothetical protein